MKQNREKSESVIKAHPIQSFSFCSTLQRFKDACPQSEQQKFGFLQVKQWKSPKRYLWNKNCGVGEKQFMELLQTSVLEGCCALAKGSWGSCLTAALATVRVAVQGFLQVWVQICQWKLQSKTPFSKLKISQWGKHNIYVVLTAGIQIHSKTSHTRKSTCTLLIVWLCYLHI